MSEVEINQINMIAEKNLKIQGRGDVLPTVEVDLEQLLAIPEFSVPYALAELAEKDSKLTATVYVWEMPSVNFGDRIWSAFYGVAAVESAQIKVLEALEREIKANGAERVRFSDCIHNNKNAAPSYHVENGLLWSPHDAGMWYEGYESVEVDEDQLNLKSLDELDDDADNEIINEEGVLESVLDEDLSLDELEKSTGSRRKKIRQRQARSDASIKTVRRAIERVFGLPEGSVQLCDHDKKPLRGNATIATLRKRWD